MSEITLELEYLNAKIIDLETSSNLLNHHVISLNAKHTQQQLRIKALEDALTQALESISIITNTVIK
jgi:hypothetical protein